MVDGDTVDAMVDLGFGIFKKERFRLLGIDAPEKRGATREDGEAAKAFLEVLLAKLTPISIKTKKDKQGKYGRYLGTLCGLQDGRLIDINFQMIQAGHAKEYMK